MRRSVTLMSPTGSDFFSTMLASALSHRQPATPRQAASDDGVPENVRPPTATHRHSPRDPPSGAIAATDLARLTALVARLRAPDGCPWDREQTLPDLRAYLLEEAHEVAAALDSGDRSELAGELGDLLFQIVFIARLVEEAGGVPLGAALDAVEAKMIARHPHVFGGETLADAKAVREAWERRKVRTQEGGQRSLLDGATSATLPALVAAYRLTQKAAGVGFDWREAGRGRRQARRGDRRAQGAAGARAAGGGWAAERQSRPRCASGGRKRSATCCSPSRTWPGTSRSTRKGRSLPPI